MGNGYSSTDEEEAYRLGTGANASDTEFFYSGPIIRRMEPTNGAAYGGDLLHLFGDNFGNGSALTEVHVGTHGLCTDLVLIDCKETDGLDDCKHITCRTPPGATRDNGITLQVGQNVARQTQNFTFHYRLPYVQCVDSSSTTTGGGERIKLMGRDFGRPELEPTVFMGGKECVDVQYISENVLTCIAPPLSSGVDAATGEATAGGAKYDVVVTVLDGTTGVHHDPHFVFSGIGNGLMSYRRPVVERVRGKTSGPSYGRSEFEIEGVNVGIGRGKDVSPPTILIGGMPCIETTVLTNFSLLCLTPAYNASFHTIGTVGRDGNELVNHPDELPITILLGPDESVAVADVNYTFLPPIVDVVQGKSFGAQYGGEQLTLIGTRMGLSLVAKPSIMVGSFPCTRVQVHESGRRVTCVTTAGTGADLPITLNNGMDAVINTEFTFTYQSSTVTRVLPSEARWYGSEWIIIDGRHLGSAEYVPVVTVGGSACQQTRFMGTSLQCMTPPGHEKNALVSVRVNNVTTIVSGNDTLAYTPPVIELITAGSSSSGEEAETSSPAVPAVPQYGGSWISIRGRNLVATSCYDQDVCNALTTSIRIGRTKCNRTMRERGDGASGGAMTLLCRTTAKPHAGSYPVIVTGNSMRSIASKVMFEAPSVVSVQPQAGAFNEFHRLTLRGKFFGDRSGNFTTEVTVGGQPCTSVVRRSSELLTCTSPLGAEYMLSGLNGTEDHEAPIRVSVDGVSSTGRVVFTRTSKINSNKTEFEYLPPTVSSVRNDEDEDFGPAFGYQNVTIRGTHFGRVNRGSVVAMIGGHPCVQTLWIDQNTASCLTPTLSIDARIQHDVVSEAHGTDVPAVVEIVVDGVHSDSTALNGTKYHYKLPRVFKVHPGMGPAYGGTRVTILGKRLGDVHNLDNVMTEVDLGPFQCQNVTVVDQFEIQCTTAPGRSIYPVDVTVNGVPSIYNTVSHFLFFFTFMPVVFNACSADLIACVNHSIIYFFFFFFFIFFSSFL